MKEIKDIIAAYDIALSQNISTALATVVHVDGSSYRRAGAKMLITSTGQLTGAISGGCLEGDALRKAQLVMMEQKTMLVTYDTSDEDDAKLGMGLGCNGIIHVLIEPVQEKDPYNPIAFLKEIIKKRQRSVLITLFSLRNKKDERAGTQLIYRGDENVFGNTKLPDRSIIEDAIHALGSNQSIFKNYGAEPITAFIQVINPPVSMVILGAGNDVKPLVDLAEIIGWETTVIDGRAGYPTRERFPSASKLLIRKADHILNDFVIDGQTVFLLMTHNYNYDLAALKILMKQPISYVGMLGPKKKLERMQEEFNSEEISAEQLAYVHTPAGLDIGAETPEEIALSIIAEIKAIIAGKEANSLKALPGVIHSRISSIIK